jgi:putative MATE family efflux protein
MAEPDSKLTEAPIKELIKNIAWPVSLGFFFNTMYNVLDTYFGGRISTQALAALSLSFPVFFLIIVFDSGTSTGTTAIIANALGAGEFEKAKKYSAQSLSFAFILSIVVTVAGILISPWLFHLLGATAEYLSLALSFMNIIFLGSVFFMMISVMNSPLQASGNTKTYRNFLIAGFFLNCIFDPWFLYGGLGVPAMGLQGIALATVTIEFIGCIYIFLKARKTGLFSKETIKYLKPELESFKAIAGQAIPASLNLATIGIGIFVITYFISHFGENAVAAYGIATRVEQIALLPTIGLTIAALTIIGQNNGAKRYDRVKETLFTCLRYGVTVMVFGAIAVFFLRKIVMSFFTGNSEVVAIGSHYLIFAAITFLAYPLLFISVSALQGMKRPMYPLWIGLYRQIIAPIIVFYILTHVFNLGISGIWLGVVLITWSAALITLAYVRFVFKKLQ